MIDVGGFGEGTIGGAMRLLALAAFLGFLAALVLRPRLELGQQPDDPPLPIFDPRTQWSFSNGTSRTS